MYIYESHMGGMYASDEFLDEEELFCETCGDSDYLIGKANTKEEVRAFLKGYDINEVEKIANMIEEDN